MRRLALAWGMMLAAACPAYAAMEDYPAVQLRALDKSTARTTTFDVTVGSTLQYGSLYIKPQACRKSDPMDKPENAAFLQVWELPPEDAQSRWVFSGWMFSSSPALSAMDHPVYDVWVLNCTGKEEEPEAVEEPAPAEETDATSDDAPDTEPEVQEEDVLLD